MKKIFYAKRNQYTKSEDAVIEILQAYFSIPSPKIVKTKNGKPLIDGKKDLFFSISHTKDMLFIAFSDTEIGLDIEQSDRTILFSPIVSKFSESERKTIVSSIDFLKNFTAKESAVKFLGGKLALDFYKLSVINGQIYYNNSPLPALLSYPVMDGYILAVVSEKDFSYPEFILL